MAGEKTNQLIGLDGLKRDAQSEENLNLVFKEIFLSKAGKEILAYLRAITIDSVAGPDINDTQLRHLEGQRYIVGLISRRVNKGISQSMVKVKENE